MLNVFRFVFLFFILCGNGLYSQNSLMRVKQPNLFSFPEEVVTDSNTLQSAYSVGYLNQKEGSALSFNAPCTSCVEEVRKRGATSRFFIDKENTNRYYSQESFLPIHYRNDEKDYWRLIDFRLRPDVNLKGRYVADRQPVVSICDLNEKNTSLISSSNKIVFNNELTLYIETMEGDVLPSNSSSYTQFSIGEEGLAVKNVWDGIDMQQVFSVGEVKSSYIIEKPLQLPLTKGWLVIEDYLQLSEGCKIQEEKPENKTGDGFYTGSYLVTDRQGELLFIYHSPVFFDSRLVGMHAKYKLSSRGEGYSLQMYIPVAWLSDTTLSYPLTIDPIVTGVNQFGNYTSTGLTSAQLGFTSEALGSCDYHLTVNVPGKSQLKDVYAELEYQLTYDANCGNPNLLAPFCTFSQVRMEMFNDSCQISSGNFSCNPSAPPWTGTCTTDSNLVPSANPIVVTASEPSFLNCLPVQLNDYSLAFTLKNRDSICGDVCGQLCARGNMWRVTVTAETIDSLVSVNEDVDDNSFKIIPTLTMSDITISVSNEWVGGDAAIYDFTGRIVDFFELTDKQKQYSVQDLQRGIYFLVANAPKGLKHITRFLRE